MPIIQFISNNALQYWISYRSATCYRNPVTLTLFGFVTVVGFAFDHNRLSSVEAYREALALVLFYTGLVLLALRPVALAVAGLVTPVAGPVFVPNLPRLPWQEADPPARLARLALAGGLGLVALAWAVTGRVVAAGQLHLRLVGRTWVGRVAAGSSVRTGFQLMGNKQFRMEFFLETSVCVDFPQYTFENIYVQFL